MGARTKNKLAYWCFVAPIFIPFIIFYIIPVLMSFYYSLFDWNGISLEMDFIGLRNYISLFTNDPNYFRSMQFSFQFAILNVLLSNTLAILLAVWVNKKLKTSNFMRAAFFMPNVICAIVAGFLWRFIFNQVPATLYQLTSISALNIKWLATGDMAFYAVLVVSLWQSVGYNMIIYLAGLTAIDPSFYESAEIDGAGKATSFFHITLPLLMPSITICLFITTAQSFRLFDMNLSLTNGGPGRATMGLALDIFDTAFAQNRMGYGSAKAVILLIVVMTITMLQVNATRKQEVEM